MGYAVRQEERRCKTCRTYLKKLGTEPVDCALISKRAIDPQKKVLFDHLADHLAVLERAIEAKGPSGLFRRQPLAGGEPGPRSPSQRSPMKFVEPSHFTDPDATVRKLMEIANATEPAQDGRIYIELFNAAFLKAGGTAEQFRDGNNEGAALKNRPGSQVLRRRNITVFRILRGVRSGGSFNLPTSGGLRSAVSRGRYGHRRSAPTRPAPWRVAGAHAMARRQAF
jgi:hypothetical protein